MPSSHYYGLWKNIPRCLPQIQMGLAGHLRDTTLPSAFNAFCNTLFLIFIFLTSM